MKSIRLDQSRIDIVLQEAVEVLRQGGIVVVPTDTVYGLAVDAMSDDAVKKLTQFKSRPVGKPISVFVESLDVASEYVSMTEDQHSTLESILPGPFTIVLPSKGKTSSLLESEAQTLGIRIPEHDFISRLVRAYGKPITATSANIAGKSPHYSIQTFQKSLSKRKEDMIGLIVDAGKLPLNKPSTVVDLTGGTMKTLRQGDTSVQTSQDYLTTTQQETQKIAQDLMLSNMQELVKKPVVFLLFGDLGAGKTEFVKGIAASLGEDSIVSPTFVIYYEYALNHGSARYLYHFDLYRLQDDAEFKHLGIQELLKPGNVLCIEWSEKSGAIADDIMQKAQVIRVELQHVPQSDEKRKITVTHL